MILSTALRTAALQELKSLRHYARVTGEDLTTMIGIPEDVRAVYDAIVAAYPHDPVAMELRDVCDMRDYMLERVQESGNGHLYPGLEAAPAGGECAAVVGLSDEA